METQTKRETVHFSLGENAGVLLMNIAQEHLKYGHNPKKAIKAISESLIGIDMSMALKILKGDIVLHVETGDDGHQVFMASEYDESIHSKIFPRLNPKDYCKRITKQILETGADLNNTILQVTRDLAYNQSFNVDLSIERVLEFLSGETKELLQEIQDDENITQLAFLIAGVKSFTEQSIKQLSVAHFMRRTWPEDFKDELDNFEVDARLRLKEVSESFSNLISQDFTLILKEEADLNNYLEASREIDRIVKQGIEPVNIMANYSAGWLSPEGEYYALNGEIANMLHNQLADALLDKGIIPIEYKDNNPDNYLLKEGWVKIHDNEVDFEGHMNESINRGDNTFMTIEQIDLITEYCRTHHRGIVKVFHQPLSALSFQSMIKGNKIGFYQKYLNW